MNEIEYREAVKACPRVAWSTQPFNLRTRKSHRRTVAGYLVREDGARCSLVADDVLRDDYAVRSLALRSTNDRLCGFIIRDKADITV